MRRALILGYYGFRNTGDEAILAAMLRDLRALEPGLEAVVASGDPGETQSMHGVRSVLFTDIAALVGAARSADLIILGGGGILHDTWGFDPDAILSERHGALSYFCAAPLLAAALDKPFAIYAVGVGPLTSEIGRVFTRAAFGQADVATVRDAASCETLLSIGVDPSRFEVAADPAFGVVPCAADELRSLLPDLRPGSPILGVVVRNWDVGAEPTHWESEFARGVDLFLDQHPDAVARFVPFQDLATGLLDDVAIAERIRETLSNRDRAATVLAPLGPAEKAGLLAASDVLLGMRLHSVIFGIRAGVPTVPVVYDAKVKSLVAEAGLEAYAVEPAGLDGRDLAERLGRAWKDRAALAPRLKSKGEELAERARRSASLVAPLLRQRPAARPASPELLELFKRAAISRLLPAPGGAGIATSGPAAATPLLPDIPAARGEDILCLPIIDWGFRFQRPQQLLSRFAADGHRVFYLKTGFLGLDRVPTLTPVRERVFEVGLPGEHDFDIYSRTLEGETLAQAFDAIAALAGSVGLEDVVVVVQYPSWEPLARRLRESFGWRIVYDCMDEHTGFGTHGESTARDEQRLVEESDLVLVTSTRLLEKVRPARPDVLRLPNAADEGHFGALPPRTASPLASLPRPVVGYYGAIAAWFDAPAVVDAAARHPGWSFVLVGDTKGASLEALEGAPNVQRVGEVAYEALPAYVAGFDICAIPFLRTPLTEATNPVKLFEYLATGKPIVARRLPELEPFAEFIQLYQTSDELSTALERAARPGPDEPARAERRRKIARENTWEARYRTLRARLDALPPRVAARALSSGSEAALRADSAIASRTREIRRLDGIVREQAEGIQFLRSEVAGHERQLVERERDVAMLNQEVHRFFVESEERRAHLEHAMRELAQWENSRLGRVRRFAQSVRAVPGRARRALGRATAPGTIPFAIGSRLIPRPAAIWLRRVVAPVAPAQPETLVRLDPAETRPGPRTTDAVPMEPTGRYDVIVFSIIDWDFRFQRPQQIATQFGRQGHRVLYLSTTQFLAPGGPAWDVKRKAERVAELRIRSPRPLDIYRGRLDPAEVEAIAQSFEELARDLSMGDAVCLVQIPFWAPLAARLRERFGWRVVYDCMDEWTNFPGFGAGVLALEEAFVRTADLTVVSADRLQDKWTGVARRLALAKNGMDAEHYRARFGPNQLLGKLRHPVIGYYGALASWVDVPLLEKIARRYENGTVVLAGGQFDVDLTALSTRPNVRLLGQRPYDEMPQLLWNFDACVIPFLVNDITEATNPVKFYEYLYGGKPVVAPALTELLPYERLSYLARGHDEFLAQLDRALAEPAEDSRRAERRRVAEENDWAHRLSAIDAGIRESHPLVSIVIVTYGGLELTRACLASLFEKETWPRFEVVVVDNASSDGTPDYLKSVAARDARVRCVFNAENRGFAGANNQGIALARGDVVVLLNNDTVVPPGLFGRLVAHLERDPKIGLLCPTTNFCGNEALVEADYSEIAGLAAFAARRAREFRGRLFDLPVAAMYCVAARRAVLAKVGPLDEAYGVGMFEDDDLAVRMRAAGFRVCCAEDAYVHHVGQGAFRKFSPEEYERLWKKNQAYFEKKFGIAWKPHAPREGVARVVSRVGTG